MPNKAKVIVFGWLATLSLAVMACGTTATEIPLPATQVSTDAAPAQPAPTDRRLATPTPPPADTATPVSIQSPPPQLAVTLVQAPRETPVTLPTPIAFSTETPTPAPTPTATPAPAPTLFPTPTRPPAPTATPTPAPLPTPNYVRPTGYDIFAPGGLQGDCESNPEPVFPEHITDLSLIAHLTPAGTVQGGDLKPHGYLGNKPSALEVPVYAPVDSYLIDGDYYRQGDDAIYQFKFQVSCEVAYYFDHLRSVVSEIQEVVPDVATADSRGTAVYPPQFFQAGDMH